MEEERNAATESQDRARALENATRRRLLKAGAAAVPVMVTIKSAGAQVVDGTTQAELLSSIGCLRNAQIPANYQIATDDVAEKLGLMPGESTPEDVLGEEGITNQGAFDVQNSRSAIGSRLSQRLEMGNLNTEATIGQVNYEDWTYEDFQAYFQEGSTDFYPDAEFDPSSEYQNTYLQITMSSACWNSIQSSMT